MHCLLPWSAFARAGAIVGAALLLGPVARAACTLSAPAAVVDLGQPSRASLLPSELAGYQQLGPPRVLTVSVSCEAPRASLRLRALHVSAAGTPSLLRWDQAAPVGALRLRLREARADGVPVALIGENGVASAQRDIGHDGEVLALDLRGLPQGARQFQVEIEMLGLVESGFVPTGRTVFSMKPRLEIVEP